MHYLHSLFLFLFLSLSFHLSGIAPKKALDEEAYKQWRYVNSYELSMNGKWVKYRYLYHDNEDKNKDARQTYYLYEVKTGKTITLNQIDFYQFFASGEWITYSRATSENNSESPVIARSLKNQKETVCPEGAEFSLYAPQFSYFRENDQALIIKNIETNDSIILEHIGNYQLYDRDSKIIYIEQTPSCNIIRYGNVFHTQQHKTLYRDSTKSLSFFRFDEREKKGSFIVIADTHYKTAKNLYIFSLQNNSAIKLVDYSEIDTLSMDIESAEILGDNKFLLYDLPTPRKPRPSRGEKDESFQLELWSWNDEMIPSQQAKGGILNPMPSPSKGIFDLQRKKHYKICDSDYSALYIQNGKDPKFAFKTDNIPYQKFRDWQHDTRYDLYLVNLADGESKMIAQALTRPVQWTPNGDHILFFDNTNSSWILLNPETFTRRKLTDEIPYPLQNELYDRPNPAPPYGIAGWSNDGKKLLVYDRYDIWVVDLEGEEKTHCWTKGAGRKHHTVFRFVNPERNELFIDLNKTQEIYSMNWENKDHGIYQLSPHGKLTPKIEGAFDIEILQESEDRKTVVCFKQSYEEERDLWICDRSFKRMKKITSANPQQKEYAWGSVQQVEWTNYDGKRNQGLLYLPDNYDPNKSYPSIVTFYETHTPEMHIHPVPGLSHAMIDIPTYVSKGYIVFQPDVYFKIGEPGKSSYNAVVSGTKALMDRQILDSNRIGLQGHSWSGFQVAYIVTRTDLFKCVNIGAALINITSVYTGIRDEGGIACMLMYEDWQCRMGKTLWEDLPGYIENSPLLFADKIHTPALIFHCDKDEAVAFYDGRNLFLALRRLQRPAWLLNYMGEGHFLRSRPAQVDWTIRMEQFFDHYLKDTPLPRWMKEGINIKERGYDQKYDLTK